MPEPFPQPAVERPRVWWSPTEGVIEETARRWHDEEPRTVRTRDRRVVAIPDDAVELLVVASVPDRSMVDTIRQVLHDMEHGCREEPGGHQRLAEEIARRLRAQSTPDTPEPLGDMVDRMAGALREVTIDLGQTRIHLSGGERRDIALNTALVAFESPRWRQLAKEAHDAARRERVVYRERAQLVAVLAHFYPSVWSYSDPAEPEWPVVYINTPQGQCSWHLSPEDVDLFGHIKQVGADDPRALWDGHSTVEKYRRLAQLAGPDGGARCSGVDEPSTVEDGGQP